MALQLYEDDLLDEEVLSTKLITLAEIIVRKHFYASREDKEDLVSIGVLKAVRMIHSDNFRSDKGNLCTFLYTGMRNDMHNFLYHKNKFDTVDFDTTFDNGGSLDYYFEDEVASVDYSLVHLICMRFKCFGDALEDKVISKLKSYGFKLDGYISHKVGSQLKCNNDIVNRVVGLLFWEMRQRELSSLFKDGVL